MEPKAFGNILVTILPAQGVLRVPAAGKNERDTKYGKEAGTIGM
jgi:hypothetical protein